MSRAPQFDTISFLFDAKGARKYVSHGEWVRFLDTAQTLEPKARALCELVAFTGCRISEALAVTVGQLDPELGSVIFRTLKRRRRVYRAVPVPREVMERLTALAKGRAQDERLWPWCRQTGWRKVKGVMADAGVAGVQATAKGLRHGFGIANAENNVPASLTQRWLGHAQPSTTAIYQDAVGLEERSFAERLWKRRG